MADTKKRTRPLSAYERDTQDLKKECVYHARCICVPEGSSDVDAPQRVMAAAKEIYDWVTA